MTLGIRRGDPADRAVRDREHIELRPDLRAHLLGLGRVLHEGDRAAVGGPGGVDLAQVAVGELPRLAADQGHEVEMPRASCLAGRHEAALVLDERQRGVHPPVKPLHVGPACDGEGRDAAAPGLLLQAVGLRATPAVQQRFPVRREQRQRVHAADLERFAARCPRAEEPHVVVEPLALARERQQRPVGRPHRARRLGGGAGVAEWRRRAVGGRHPDLGVAPVLVFDRGRDRERHPPRVRREPRLADECEAVVVGGLEGAGSTLRGQAGGQKADRQGGQQRARVHTMLKCVPGGRKLSGGAGQCDGRSAGTARPTARPPDRRRYGSLCSSTRRFSARPAAVALGAM